jgi:hypothetical protein
MYIRNTCFKAGWYAGEPWRVFYLEIFGVYEWGITLLDFQLGKFAITITREA